MALLATHLLSIPSILFSDSPWPVYQWRGEAISRLVTRLKKLALRFADVFIAQGRLAKQYLLSLGVSADRIRILPINCVDVDTLNENSQPRELVGRRVREQLGIEPRRIILFVGRLVEGKGLFVLLEAYALLKKLYSDLGLVVVGGGPERRRLEEQVAQQELPDVYLVGPQEYEDLPGFYGMAECLVLPTYSDTWGLVVLEAFACGLPVVTTTRCGSVPDLISERGTGAVVEPGNPTSLVREVEQILCLPLHEMEEMRQRCRSVALEYDCASVVRGLAKLLASELQQRSSCGR
jgi:glycosyltransferase involved in cell wall biosynthesis